VGVGGVGSRPQPRVQFLQAKGFPGCLVIRSRVNNPTHRDPTPPWVKGSIMGQVYLSAGNGYFFWKCEGVSVPRAAISAATKGDPHATRSTSSAPGLEGERPVRAPKLALPGAAILGELGGGGVIRTRVLEPVRREHGARVLGAGIELAAWDGAGGSSGLADVASRPGMGPTLGRAGSGAALGWLLGGARTSSARRPGQGGRADGVAVAGWGRQGLAGGSSARALRNSVRVSGPTMPSGWRWRESWNWRIAARVSGPRAPSQGRDGVVRWVLRNLARQKNNAPTRTVDEWGP
jgi:hypothetical protein